jgi:macrodomain Ter protein organizer (MatP/YcbG family)
MILIPSGMSAADVGMTRTKTLHIDSDVWRRLKIEAAKRDTSIQDLVSLILDAALEQKEDRV